ncbi:unnamed protein product [Rodentolepis nana]|uniref:Phorbol-ester/DAG-type domain-containing protein n=1 Tax=Rodentolepis nana TaxID=102285 RepID=A0A0R3T602_RODNA|nr:unnamed protein product [Rodentolepis nana]
MSQEVVHNLVRVSVGHPRICCVCEDYIVTPRCTARQCITCECVLHASCFVKAEKCEYSNRSSTKTDTSVAISLSDQVRTLFFLNIKLYCLS